MPRLRPTLWLLTAILSVSFAAAVAQVSSPSVSAIPDRVEEDWQLVVANPDPLGVGPQVTTCMAPDSASPRAFVAFDMNYRDYPSFQAGGMQVQTWSSGQVLATAAQGWEVFNTINETVSWTQRMWVSGGRLYYNIENGQSTTWGRFGGGSNLALSYPSTANDLGGYNVKDSVARSGVTWESNDVSSLVLVRVRYYANGQLVWTDNNPKTLIGQ